MKESPESLLAPYLGRYNEQPAPGRGLSPHGAGMLTSGTLRIQRLLFISHSRWYFFRAARTDGDR